VTLKAFAGRDAKMSGDKHTFSMKLKEIIDLQVLQQMQDKFARATGLAAVIVSKEGEPITQYSNNTPYCRLIHSSPAGRRRCTECDISLGNKALLSQKIAWHICHGGLVDISSPIVVDGIYIGQVMCGQVLFDKPEKETVRNDMKERGEKLGLPWESLMEHFERIKLVTPKHLFDCAELLTIIGSYIVECGMKSLMEKELHEKEIQIVEINAGKAEMEKTLKELELKALQSQVNPHFLFNALNTIARCAMFENADSTQDITYNLAQLLRYSLRKTDIHATLRDEIHYVMNYLAIQKKRFGERVKFRINVPPEALDFRLPAMTLQPLVENSIIHGLEPKRTGGTVVINGRIKDRNLLIEVIDSGLGIPEERLREVFGCESKGRGTCIGLSNVKKRLYHYFNSKAQMHVESKEKYWTKISMLFPYE